MNKYDQLLDDLSKVIADIGKAAMINLRDNSFEGPHRWGDPDLKFGPQEDYEITEFDGRHIFWFRSEAGREWAYAKFPPDCPRYGLGFIIDAGIDTIRACAWADGLMSLEEYEKAMNEKQNIERQW